MYASSATTTSGFSVDAIMNQVIQNHMHPDEAAYIAAYIVEQILVKNLTIHDVDGHMILDAVKVAEAYTELREE